MNALNLENDVERADALRQSALSFVETLEARANETEKLRQLSVETVANLKSIGFSRLCQPRKFGGAELPRNLAVDVLSILAGGCASTARVCAVYTDHSILSSVLNRAGNYLVNGDGGVVAISPTGMCLEPSRPTTMSA